MLWGLVDSPLCGPSRASGQAPEHARTTAFGWWARISGRRLGQCLIRGQRLALRAAACSVGAGSLRGWQLAPRAPEAAARSVGAESLWGRQHAPWAPARSVGGSSVSERRLALRAAARIVSPKRVFFNAPVSATSAVAFAESDAIKKTRLGRWQNRTCRLRRTPVRPTQVPRETRRTGR